MSITRFEGRNLSDRSATVIDDAVLIDYLEYNGEWDHPSPLGYNKILGELLGEILTAASPPLPVQPLAVDLRIKIAVIGPPLAGSTTVAKRLEEEFNLVLLSPVGVARKEIENSDALGRRCISLDNNTTWKIYQRQSYLS